jgi:hypothetical protein
MSDAAFGAYLLVLGVLCWLVAPGARGVEAMLMESIAHAWSESDAGAARFGTTMAEIAFYALRIGGVVAAAVGAALLLGA